MSRPATPAPEGSPAPVLPSETPPPAPDTTSGTPTSSAKFSNKASGPSSKWELAASIAVEASMEKGGRTSVSRSTSATPKQSVKGGSSYQMSPASRGLPRARMDSSTSEEDFLVEGDETSVIPPAKSRYSSLVESLDYEFQETDQYRAEQINRTSRDLIATMVARWAASMFIGIGTGLFAFIINLGVENLSGMKFAITLSLMNTSYIFSFLTYMTINVLLVLSSALLVVYIGPAAAGSGIPDVKAYLNGINVPGILHTRTLVAKVFGAIGAVSGGLAVGKEGPLVHIGSCIASMLSPVGSLANRMRFRWLKIFMNDRDRRDLVTCGCAAGVAAAFRAPVGGVLFALEEATSFWRSQLTWRTFFTCAIVVVTLKVSMKMCEDPDNGARCGYFGDGGFIIFEVEEGQDDFEIEELVPMAMLGVVGGILGALFNHLNEQISLWRKHRWMGRKSRVLEVCGISVLTSAISFCVPLFFSCTPCPDDPNVVCPRDDLHYGNFVQFRCSSPHSYNDIATLFFNTQDDAIRNLFSSNTTHEYSFWALLTFLCIYYPLSCITYGISVPSGLFVPSIICGAAYGRIVGMLMVHVFDSEEELEVDEGTYALLGAASFLAGAMRMTVSLCVILLELTNNLKLLPLVMLVLLIAKVVGDGFNKAIYDIHIELKDLPFLEEQPERFLRHMIALDAASQNLVDLRRRESLRRIKEVFTETSHNAFPVYSTASNGTVIFIGLILRSSIFAMLRSTYSSPIASTLQRAGNDADDMEAIAELRRPFIRGHGSNDGVGATMVASNELFRKLSDDELDTIVDLKPYCNTSPYIVPFNLSLSKTYLLFRGMGLRHLCVIKESSQRLVGIITRKDLDEETLRKRLSSSYS